MRTTVDLPDDLHALARRLAYEGNRSMSDVIVELIRVGLRRDQTAPTSTATTTVRGLPQVSVGRPITADDVRSLDDDA